MTVSQIIGKLQEVERLFGNIELEVMVEASHDPRNIGVLCSGFIDVFTNTHSGRGRVAILRIETENREAERRSGTDLSS